MQRSRALPETLVNTSVLRTVDGRTLEWDVGRWMAPADQVDESLLDRAIGPVLDVGCGPGRHVSSLLSRGVEALGIDSSPAAVRLARRRGASVAHQSIFDPVPDAGLWRCVLLLDGSIGIGGNPLSLLRRVSGVLSKRGRLLVETVHPQQPSEDLRVRVETATNSGPWFRWSVVSHPDVATLAYTSGFQVNDTWEEEGRYFAQLERVSDP
jgi:SAM-dependent methyltransferase